jgi:hypothetical protein
MIYDKPMETPHIELPVGHPHLDGLRAWYVLNESGDIIADWAGNGNILTNADATWVSFVENGVSKYGLKFQNHHYASFDNTKQLINSEAGTVIISFKSDSSINDGTLRTLFGAYNGWSLGKFALIKNDSDNAVYFLLSDGGVHYIVFNSSRFPDWQTGYQLAILWDRSNTIANGDNMVLNVNGSHWVPNSGAGETSWNPFTVLTTLSVGGDLLFPGNDCRGIISDVRIFNKVIPESQIEDIYENQYESLYTW